MICKLPQAVSLHPAGEVGVPATKKFEPPSRPTVAPPNAPGSVGPATGVSVPARGAKQGDVRFDVARCGVERLNRALVSYRCPGGLAVGADGRIGREVQKYAGSAY